MMRTDLKAGGKVLCIERDGIGTYTGPALEHGEGYSWVYFEELDDEILCAEWALRPVGDST